MPGRVAGMVPREHLKRTSPMSAILSAFGPAAWKALLGGLIAALTFIVAQLDAGASIDVLAILKALLAGLTGHQAVYWKANG